VGRPRRSFGPPSHSGRCIVDGDMNNPCSLPWIRAIREERVKQSKGTRFCSMNHVALNDAPGGNIVTTWNGTRGHSITQSAYSSSSQWFCSPFPVHSRPSPSISDWERIVMDAALALVPGDEIVPIVVGVRTELGRQLQPHCHASAFQFTCLGVGNPA
jgi:hypothetical protein